MGSSTEKLKDKWFRLIGIPLVALVANVLFFYDKAHNSGYFFLLRYLHSIFHAWILWETARQIIIWTRIRFSSFAESKKRIRYTSVLVVITTTVLIISICTFYDVTGYWGYRLAIKDYVYNIFVALMYAVIIGGIYEAIYFFSKWREAFVEAEALKNANLQSQFDCLKSQINPHFLFNSLSCLSSLITEDSARAEKFVDELAAVYRYLLKTNEKELTTLSKELKFISAYFHLLKTRFGKNIHIVLDVNKMYMHYLLPPLTLQILLENAVKHNVILPGKPLTIKLYMEEDKLIVLNNLEKKQYMVESGKLGLANIAAKYKLLRQPKIEVLETTDYFKVSIPLIEPQENQYKDYTGRTAVVYN